MNKIIKNYWLELLVFGAISLILIIDCAPSPTWVNTDSDGIHYVYASQYLVPAHKQSAPLFLLLGHLFLYIPFGTEFWRMALISVLSGIIGSLFIYLIIRNKLANNRKSKYYALVGSLIYGGSALVISQSTIVETYSLATTVCLAVYYFAIKQKWVTSCIMAGIALAVHPTSLLILLPIFIGMKELRNWKRLVIVLPFFLFYLYVPITNRPPYMWQLPKAEVGSFNFVSDAVATIQMLVGGLAIYDLPKRILDTAGLLLLNFAVIGVIPIVVFFKVIRFRKSVLFWLFAIPIVYFSIDMAVQVYVYLQFAIAFGAIAVGLGLSKVKPFWLYSTLLASITLLSINAWYFDIGSHLDPNLSATKYYKEELVKVPDGQILMPYYGWEWAAIYPYDINENRNIIPVCIDTLVGADYQKLLTDQGIKLEDNKDPDRLARQNFIALSIVRLNDNVWTTRTTDAETYGCEVIKLDKNNFDVSLVTKTPTEPPGRIHWKPSNPYRIIDGSLEVKEWGLITLSNWNVMLFVGLGSIGMILNWIIFVYPQRKKNRENSSCHTVS